MPPFGQPDDSPTEGEDASKTEEPGYKVEKGTLVYDDAPLTEYRFTSHSSDFGKVSVVGSVITSRGVLNRGETIELTEAEANVLKKGGARLTVVSDE